MYLLETELKLERIENKPNNNGINDNLHATTFFFFFATLSNKHGFTNFRL